MHTRDLELKNMQIADLNSHKISPTELYLDA